MMKNAIRAVGLLFAVLLLSPAPTPASESQPTEIGSPLLGMRGWATWYDDGPGLYGAVNSYRFGDPRYHVTVCASRCVVVQVRDYCACGDRHGEPTVIDLSPDAFSALAPLSRGIVRVTVSTEEIALPPTDMETP